MGMNLQNRNFYKKKSHNADVLKTILEQYKLYVEMTDRVSQRRMSANAFFITVNTLSLAVAAFTKGKESPQELPWVIFAGIFGCVISIVWYFVIRSYKQLNAGKFTIINKIEKQLPLLVYTKERKWLKPETFKSKYWPLSHVEMLIPWVFFFIYIALIVFQRFPK